MQISINLTPRPPDELLAAHSKRQRLSPNLRPGAVVTLTPFKMSKRALPSSVELRARSSPPVNPCLELTQTLLLFSLFCLNEWGADKGL